jgi:PTS system ascorbate-specific IIA component
MLLTDLLKKENIKVNAEVNTWKEAGEIAGKLLVKAGSVEPGYVDAMIASVEKYGPYIVIAPGIALFHARPQDGVKEICMSLVTLKKGVGFNAGEKDPVNLAIAFGATDNKAHLKALSELMEILRDQNTINRILSSKDEDEVLEVIKGKMKNKEGVI